MNSNTDFTLYSDKYPPKNRADTGVSVLSIEIADAMGRFVFDPNRMAVAAATQSLPVLESAQFPSVLSGQPGVSIRTCEVALQLTHAEALRMYRHDLHPSEVRVLLETFGAFHEIHDDFYDERTFEALQPMEAPA